MLSVRLVKCSSSKDDEEHLVISIIDSEGKELDTEFANKLLMSKKVAVVPGSAFGEFGKYYIRCSYAYSMKNLMGAMKKIKEFIQELKQ